MKHFFQRLIGSTLFIVGVAFVLRMFAMWMIWHQIPIPIKANMPYGYELGRVARAIVSGEGFSSPLRNMDTGPTAWFTPIYPYFVAGIFKVWGIYTNTSRFIIATMNCLFAALTIIPIYNIAKRAFGEGVSICASWVWVFLPTAIHFTIILLWDTALTALFFYLIFWATLSLRGIRKMLQSAGTCALGRVEGWVSRS